MTIRIFLSLLLSIAVISCTQETPDDGKKILKWSTGAELQGLDPHVVTGVPENRVLTALCEGLTSYHPAGAEPQPGTALTWDIDASGTVYTFHLNPNSFWSDGMPVTSEDYLFSWERVLSPKLGSQYAEMLFFVKNAEDFYKGEIKDFSKVGIKAIDDKTVEVTLNGPVPFFLDLLSHYSTFGVPKHVVLAHGEMDDRANPWTKPDNFVCNGPFNLISWHLNKSIKVEKNPAYWDQASVKLDGIHFFPLTNNKTEFNSFKSGRIHITSTVPLETLKELRASGEPNLRLDPYMGTYFYRLNTERAPFNDIRVRRALAYSIDRKSLVEQVTGGGELPAYSFTPPDEVKNYLPDTSIPYDPDLARKLLKEAGFPGGKGFPVKELIYNTSEGHRKLALAIQDMWAKELGIHIDIVNQDWKVYLHRQRTMNFDISRAGWIGDYPDPLTFLNIMVTGRGNNETGFSNKTFDRIVEKDSFRATGQERYELLKKAERILIDQMPLIPIYVYTNKYMISPEVTGWETNLMGNHPPKYLDISSAK